MDPLAIIREALKTLLRNKLRSTLTVLGVTIGIGAVICVVAIGSAGSQQAQQQLYKLGDNLIWIEAGSRAPNGIRSGARGTKTLVVSDLQAIRREIPLIKSAAANVDGPVQLIYANMNWGTTYRGVSPEYLDIKRWDIESGASFTHDDVERASDVCILGATVRKQLYGGENPIGTIMRVKDMPCKVIGVLAAKGNSATGQDQDDTILLPYTTAMKKLTGKNWLDDIMCSAASADAVRPATEQIKILLRERHKLRSTQDDDFNIRSPEEFIKLQIETSRTFTMLLLAIGSVSLLVGGIGIMNVMLVSVTERTREIGVRMAVGATEGHVQVQFLGEAIILSLFGGFIGVLTGVAGSFILGHMLEWPMSISAESVGIAVVFAVMVGIFFGYYPAWKASRLDPIEALRFE
jgi:putative ABC transport system permease protein